jgi:hypothetical protein
MDPIEMRFPGRRKPEIVGGNWGRPREEGRTGNPFQLAGDGFDRFQGGTIDKTLKTSLFPMAVRYLLSLISL